MQEYSTTRPLSAGAKPRSTSSIPVSSKPRQLGLGCTIDEDAELEGDAQPWILEGWMDEPSVVRC